MGRPKKATVVPPVAPAAAMTIEMWGIERVTPYAKNARKLSASAVDKVAASLQEFGWQQPLVVDREGVLIVGHTRLMAAKKLGWSQVPVHVALHLTPAQVKAYRLMDNRVHEESAWDFDLLAPEIVDLKAFGIDLGFTGFESREVDKFLASLNPATEKGDDCPALPENPVSRLGDMWLLGPHRVLCGDSTSAEAVSRLLSPASGLRPPFLMVTDPPYGVEYDPEWRNEACNDKQPNRAIGLVANDDRADWVDAWRLFPGDVAYVWHAALFAGVVGGGLAAADFHIRGQIIWAKQQLVMSRGAYHWQHEPCWYAVRKGKKANWHGDRKQSTLWQIANNNPFGQDSKEREVVSGHGTQKPVEVMRRPILNHTERGDAVYDPFLGSGTTVAACELTERTCYGLELDPKYVDVIVQRWQDLSGKEATLEGHGATFAHVKEGRLLGELDAMGEEAMVAAELKAGTPQGTPAALALAELAS